MYMYVSTNYKDFMEHFKHMSEALFEGSFGYVSIYPRICASAQMNILLNYYIHVFNLRNYQTNLLCMFTHIL